MWGACLSTNNKDTFMFLQGAEDLASRGSIWAHAYKAWGQFCSQLPQSVSITRVSPHRHPCTWRVPLCLLPRRHFIPNSFILPCCQLSSVSHQVTDDASTWILKKTTAYVRILSVTKYETHWFKQNWEVTIFLKWKTLGMNGTKVHEDSGTLPIHLHNTCKLFKKTKQKNFLIYSIV